MFNDYHYEQVQIDLEEAERILKVYRKYGDCGKRSSAEYDRLKKEVERLKEEAALAYYGQ